MSPAIEDLGGMSAGAIQAADLQVRLDTRAMLDEVMKEHADRIDKRFEKRDVEVDAKFREVNTVLKEIADQGKHLAESIHLQSMTVATTATMVQGQTAQQASFHADNLERGRKTDEAIATVKNLAEESATKAAKAAEEAAKAADKADSISLSGLGVSSIKRSGEKMVGLAEFFHKTWKAWLLFFGLIQTVWLVVHQLIPNFWYYHVEKHPWHWFLPK